MKASLQKIFKVVQVEPFAMIRRIEGESVDL